MSDEEKSFHNVPINWYPGHMAKTKRLLKEKSKWIDIVFELVDARIPYSSKVKEFDSFLNEKPRLLIMTKKDLCDQSETMKWQKFYEEKGHKVYLLDLQTEKNMNTKIKNIVSEMMKPIYQKREKKGLLDRKARIAVVGIPNVGKSTFINRFVSKKVVNVGNVPGVTKQLNWIRIDENIELLDTPGILWPKLETENIALNLASFTAIKEEILPLDRVAIYILNMLICYYPEIAKERYGIEKIEEDIIETLDIIGKKRGCLLKGGEIDYEKVYSLIIGDIKNGHIKGVTFDRLEG